MEFNRATLGRSDEQQLEEFLSALGSRADEDLGNVTASLRVKKSRKSVKRLDAKPKTIDPDQVVDALIASQKDEAAFQNVLADLRSKAFKVASVKIIADKFRHTTGKYKNRDDAITKIEDTWHANRRLASKQGELDDLYNRD